MPRPSFAATEPTAIIVPTSGPTAGTAGPTEPSIGSREPVDRISPQPHPVREALARAAEAASNYVTDIVQRRSDAGNVARHPVTGLPNRSVLLRDVEDAAVGAPAGLTLVVLRVNAIGRIGLFGDAESAGRFLRHVAQRMLRYPQVQRLYHLGGGDFAFWCANRPTEEVRNVAAGVLAECLLRPVTVRRVRVHPDATAGMASMPRDAATPWELLQCAMFALRAGGERGPGLFDAASFEAERDSRHLVEDLRTTVDDDGLDLHYQPIVDLPSGRIAGAEALLRWHHPLRGAVSPGRFIPLIERTALMDRVTSWVLRTGLAQLAEWRNRGSDVHLAINISTRSLGSERAADEVVTLAQRLGLPPSLIELEITETEIMQEVTTALRICERLRGHGFRIAIDDFGTGHSSLSYLRDIPADTVKLDKSFLSRLAWDETSKTLVSRVIDMCHELGLRVVAEGIETQAALDIVRSMGCDSAQGFLMAAPMPLADFHRLVLPADLIMRRSAPGTTAAPDAWDGPVDAMPTGPARD